MAFGAVGGGPGSNGKIGAGELLFEVQRQLQTFEKCVEKRALLRRSSWDNAAAVLGEALADIDRLQKQIQMSTPSLQQSPPRPSVASTSVPACDVLTDQGSDSDELRVMCIAELPCAGHVSSAEPWVTRSPTVRARAPTWPLYIDDDTSGECRNRPLAPTENGRRSSRLHSLQQTNALEVALAACYRHLVALENQSQAVTTGRQLRAECETLSLNLQELAASALESGCQRSVPGAMDVFNQANEALERVGVIIQRCQEAPVAKDVNA